MKMFTQVKLGEGNCVQVQVGTPLDSVLDTGKSAVTDGSHSKEEA